MRSTIIGVLFLISACVGESSLEDTEGEPRLRRGILPQAQQQQQYQQQQQLQQLAINYRPLGEAPDAIRQILQLQQAREPLVNIPAPAPLQLQPQLGPQANPAPAQPLPPAGPQQSPILIPQTSVQQVPAPQPYIDRYNQATLQQQQQQQQQHQQIQQQQFQQQQLRQQQQQLRLQPVYKGIQQAVQRFGPQQQPLYTPQYKTSYPAQQQLQQPPPPPSNSLYRQPLPTPLQYRAQQLQQQQQQAQQSQQTLYPSNLPPHLQSVIQAQRSYQQQG